MNEINRNMLQIYMSIVEARFPDSTPTLEILMNPSDELVNEFQSVLVSKVIEISQAN